MKLIEQLRKSVIDDLFKTPSFSEMWEPRKSFLLEKLPNPLGSKKDLIELGDSLSDLFTLVGKGDRGQGGVSKGGFFWESLICWYLNLCLYDTCAVSIKKASLTPMPILDSLSVKHEAVVLRSEPDIIILSSPSLLAESPELGKPKLMRAINSIVEQNFEATALINIQCKTNWNDNAQIPMLWNMLYTQARKGAMIQNGFTIGQSGYSLRNLAYFGYAFATVPTTNKSKFTSNHTHVLRARTMSAGNYWGYPSKNGISNSIKNIFDLFNRNAEVFPNVQSVAAYSSNNEKWNSVKTLFHIG